MRLLALCQCVNFFFLYINKDVEYTYKCIRKYIKQTLIINHALKVEHSLPKDAEDLETESKQGIPFVSCVFKLRQT
jgi:hypothetical protein